MLHAGKTKGRADRMTKARTESDRGRGGERRGGREKEGVKE